MHVDELDGPSVLPHLSLGDKKRAQAAAVAEIHFGEIDHKRLHLGLAEEEKFPFQFGRDRRIELLLFQLQRRRSAVVHDFEIHTPSALKNIWRQCNSRSYAWGLCEAGSRRT